MYIIILDGFHRPNTLLAFSFSYEKGQKAKYFLPLSELFSANFFFLVFLII